MKNVRFWAYFCAFFSLVLSLAMIGYWLYGTYELKVVDLDTFIGVTVALLGMIVTVAIAWQIYNAVEMRSKIEKLKQLEGRLKEQEKSLEKFSLEKTRDIYGLLWVHHQNIENYIDAFHCLLVSLEAEMQLEDPDQFDDILNAMDEITKKISVVNIEFEIADRIKNQDKAIRALSNYKFIKKRYETIFNEYTSKVK